MTRRLNHNYSLSVRAKGRLNIRDAGPRFASTRLAAAVIRGALILAVLSALLLIAARPAQAQIETVLYNFTGGSDGLNPDSSLISDGTGNFYGTTVLGGMGCPGWNGYGCGVVFEISPNGSGGWKETVLHSFSGPPDGANPILAPLIFDRVGNLYGATAYGGASNAGAVFELSPVGASCTETVLYSFGNDYDYNFAPSGLIMDPAGNLYGTTSERQAPGTVFELSPSGGGWTEQVIYTVDICCQMTGLTMDAAGNIYGATSSTVFELSPNGNGGWTPTVVHTFAGAPGDGGQAMGTLVFDQAGNLYGTTNQGGAKNKGTVYELSPGKSGVWTEQILHSFAGGAKDGANPVAGIAFDPAGNIYGTTTLGGSKNKGTVFEFAALGNSNYEYTVLWSFNGADGANPDGSLILDRAGNLFGTASKGGSSNAGVVFEVSGVRAGTASTLSSSLNPSTYGQAVTFTAVVTSSLGAPPDGETVTFKEGTTVLGTGAVSGGSASFTTSALPAGTDTITAVYGGDTHFAASTSNAVKQVVN